MSRWSEHRCAKALVPALSTYKDGLTAQYVEELHNAKALQAMSIFGMQARGPAAAEYAERLARECAGYWRGGRQLCEKRSLRGNRCANRKHAAPGEKAKVDKETKK